MATGATTNRERLVPSLSRAETNHRHRALNKATRRAGKAEARKEK